MRDLLLGLFNMVAWLTNYKAFLSHMIFKMLPKVEIVIMLEINFPCQNVKPDDP